MARAANVAEEGETNCFEFLRREGGGTVAAKNTV